MPVESIVSELMDVIQRHLTESVGEDLSVKEQRALAAGRRFAQTLLEEMLKADAQEPVWTTCECGAMVRSKQHESRTIVTLAGTHRMDRRKYYCGVCGKSVAPRDAELGVGSGNYSQGVVALAAEVAAGFPFETCEDFLARRFSLDICYKQIQRVAQHTGEVMALAESKLAADVASSRAEVASKEHPKELVISADGLMVHSDGCWQEMKVGSLISEYGRSTIGTMKRAEPFGELLYLEALKRGVEHADRVIFVADGAVWIWKLAEHHFPNAVQIVDWYHATQHLWEVARAWYGEGSARARAWVKRNEARLMADGVERVISSIRQFSPKDDDGRRIKRENEHYFSTNAHRMRYATFKNMGYVIGSGSVESACKQYGQGRLKLPGMHWKSSGIEAVAHLRSAVLNRRTNSIFEAARIAA